MFNSDHKAKHLEIMHKEEKVKYSHVPEGKSRLNSHQNDCEPRNIFLMEV